MKRQRQDWNLGNWSLAITVFMTGPLSDESRLPSIHVRETGEIHLLRSHKIRRHLKHLICGSKLGQILKCKGSYFVPGFSVWILCLMWLMNLWELCTNCIYESMCVVLVLVGVDCLMISCTLLLLCHWHNSSWQVLGSPKSEWIF